MSAPKSDAAESPRVAATPGGVALGLVMLWPWLLWRSVVLSTLWGWLVVPLGVRALSYGEVFGVLLVWTFTGYPGRTDDRVVDVQWVLDSTSRLFIGGLVFLAMGYVASRIIYGG